MKSKIKYNGIKFRYKIKLLSFDYSLLTKFSKLICRLKEKVTRMIHNVITGIKSDPDKCIQILKLPST